MASMPPEGTIVTQIRRPSSAIDNTRPGWPNSSFVHVFNRNGGPSATEALDGTTDQPLAETAPPRAKPGEAAELIDQGILSLGDGAQRGTIEPAHERVAELPPGKPEGLEEAQPSDQVLHGSVSDNAVAIEVRRLPTRGGRRPAGNEKYPFGAIGLAREVDGFLEGETFLIPHDDEPRKRIAAGRKRHKPKRFLTRTEQQGVRVWRDR